MVCVTLTARHGGARRMWVTEHVNRGSSDWRNILFPNDSRLSIQSDNRRIFIWWNVIDARECHFESIVVMVSADIFTDG